MHVIEHFLNRVYVNSKIWKNNFTNYLDIGG